MFYEIFQNVIYIYKYRKKKVEETLLQVRITNENTVHFR